MHNQYNIYQLFMLNFYHVGMILPYFFALKR